MKHLKIQSSANLAWYALSLAFAGLFISQESAKAASGTWLDTGSSQNWSSTANWLTGVVPGGTSANFDTATFNSAVGTVGTTGNPILIDGAYPAGLYLGNITFDTGAGSFFIGTTIGSPIKLNSTGTIQIANTLTATNSIETFNAPLTLAGNATLTNNSANGSGAGAGTLNFAGAIAPAGVNTVLTLNGSNTNQNTITGLISGSTLLVDKEGTGTWVLNNGTNTFQGGITVGGGTLVALGTAGLGSVGSSATSVLSVASGATLDVQGTPTFGGSLSGSGTITNSSNVTTANLQIRGNATSSATNVTSTFSGVIEDSNGLGTGTGKLKLTFGNNGAETLILSGNNLFTGGIATVSTTGSLLDTIIVTQLSDTGNSALGHFSGSGSGVALQTGGVFEYQSSGTNAGSTARIFTLANSGGGQVAIDSSSASALATLSLSGNLFTSGASSGTTTLILQGTNTGANTIAGIYGNGLGTNVAALTKNGAGTWVLSGANTYTAATTINAGTLQFAKKTAMSVSSPVTVNSGATLAVNAGNGTTEFTNATSGAGSIGGLFSGTGGQGSAVTLNTGSAVGIDTTNAVSGSLTYAGNITNAGVGLTKLGAGSLVLTGTNTNTGATTVNVGSLLYGAGGSSNSTGAVTVAAGGTLGTVAGNVSNMTLFTNAPNLTLNLGASTSTQSNLQLNLYASAVSDAISAGVLTLNGSGNLLVTLDDTTSNHLTGTYTLLTWTSGTSLTNSQLTLAGSAVGEGSLFISGNNLEFAVVPEPSTWAMLLSGSAALLLFGLKRRNKLS